MSVQEEETNRKSIDLEFDKKFTYSCNLLKEGLLDMARVDACQKGDGIGTYTMWKNDFINFIATGHRNYAELTFNFIAQVEFLISQLAS